MTVKTRLICTILSAIALMIAVSFLNIPISFAREGSEYYSDNSSVFSPGYLNAAKFEAETIVKQQAQGKKGLFKGLVSGLVDFVQGTIGNLIGKENNEKSEAAPVLQRKVSSPKGKAGLNILTLLQPAEISEAMRTSINTNVQQYCKDHGIAYDANSFNGYTGSIVFSNGKYYAIWNDGSNIRALICGSDGSVQSGSAINVGAANSDSVVTAVAYSNGNIAVFWNEDTVGLQYQTLDSSGNTMRSDTNLWSGFVLVEGAEINGVALSNGDVAVMWTTMAGDNPSLMFQLLNSSGNPIFDQYEPPTLNITDFNPDIPPAQAFLQILLEQPIDLTSSAFGYVTNINTLSDGGIAVSWNESGSTGYTDALKSQYFRDNYGYFNSPDTDPRNLGMFEGKSTDNPDRGAILSNSRDMSDIFRALLADKDALVRDSKTGEYDANFRQIVKGSLGESSIAIPIKVNSESMEAAVSLANILKNATEEQKFIIDSIKALLADVARLEEALNKPMGALKKAENDLLNAGVNILLAQAIPDLLKKDDIANIRLVFSELDGAKKNIFSEYEKSAKLYYESVLKDFAKNIGVLQLNNILNPHLTQAELDKLPRSEIDKILEKIRKRGAKTFEEEYILQQEVKYRKVYMEPAGKKLEEGMKKVLRDFTVRVNGILKSADKK